MRARSYQASPGPAKASALCISLWMLSVNTLVNHRIAVDQWGCGKVDNRWDADLTQLVGPLPLSTGGLRYPQPVCGACYYSADVSSTFRFPGVTDAQHRRNMREDLAAYGCRR